MSKFRRLHLNPWGLDFKCFGGWLVLVWRSTMGKRLYWSPDGTPAHRHTKLLIGRLLLATLLWLGAWPAQARVHGHACQEFEESGQKRIHCIGTTAFETTGERTALAQVLKTRAQAQSLSEQNLPCGTKTCTSSSISLNDSITILSSTQTPEAVFKVEELREEEYKSLSKLRARLQAAQTELESAERKIRLAHGENVRDFGSLECRSSRTEVELRGKYALITTISANGGCF